MSLCNNCFKFISKFQNVSDDFDDNEDLLFKFLFAFLNEFPDARVWIEEDWFYNLEDMKQIKASYNNDWCYINPKDNI